MTMLDERPVDDLDRPSPWSNAAMSSAAEVGRWRLAARLARREIRRRPWRTLLVVLLIGVPVAGMVVGDAAYRSSRLPADQSHRFGGADVRVTASGVGDAGALLDEVLADPTSIDDVLRGAEVSFVPLRSTAAPDTVVNVDLSTLDMNAPLAAGIARPTDGRLPTADDEVFLSTPLAEQLGVDVGDELSLVRPAQTFEVVGIGSADGYWRLMVAPGFDLSVLRPEVVQQVALVKGAAATDGSLDAASAAVMTDDTWVGIETPEVPATEHLALFLGWVFCIMLMAVLGLVVGAAFAVSGRRQLVTIGQLSASGTDPAVLRRYLALQGTWSGGLGVVVGMVVGLGLVPLLDGVIANDGRIAIGSVDLVVIAITALVAATLAAIVPTRDLARTSVLASLGGRRPVAEVRPNQVRIGVLLVASGLTALWLAVTSARNSNDTGDGLGAAVALAGAGGLAVLAGMCCACPLVVDLMARAGARRRGATLLATRSLGRHRARSAALVAAVAAFGAAAVAAGAVAEQEFADRQLWQNVDTDLIELTAFDRVLIDLPPPSPVIDGDQPRRRPTGEVRDRPDAVSEAVLAQVDALVGPVDWVRTEMVEGGADVPSTMLVADDALLDLIGVSDAQRAEIAAADAVLLHPTIGGFEAAPPDFLALMFGELDAIVLPGPSASPRQWVLVMPDTVERLGLELAPGPVYGRLDHGVSRAEYDAITSLNAFAREGDYFLGDVDDEVTSVMVGFPQRDDSTLARLIILGGVLLLTVVVVAVGMALWAAEGRDERDALVSIGAGPWLMARVVGSKAWLLASAGGLLAVPLGYGTLRVAVAAADERTMFPWVVAIGVVVVVPALIGVVTTAGSALVQWRRPLRMSTLATD